MSLETGTYISDLNTSNPTSSDAKSSGDDHLRLIKSTVKATFPIITGAVTPTHAEINAAVAASFSQGVSFRNKIINGGFTVNQRGYASGAAVGAGLYGHDRWKMAASGDTYTFSTTNNKTTVTIPAGKVLQQVVEGLNLQTGTYCLSWEGTAQGKIGAGSLGDSGVTGSITGGTNTTIEFGPGTVANVQLETGSVATPFENRQYGVELALCQRYYEVSYATSLTNVIAGLYYTASNFFHIWKFSQQKRMAPTMSAGGGTWSGSATAYPMSDRCEYHNTSAFQYYGTSGVAYVGASAEL